jgi:cell fate (sporulation/competence/biofilm development) regulator YlbF (YheA/YmcA/DUF963 family)
MNDKILENTYELINEIKSGKTYKRLLELKSIIEQDEELVKLIEKFNKIKTQYDEVLKYGKYHPDLKKVQIELSKIKETLYSNVIIVEYKELEKKLQSNLDLISSEIATSVSSKIKHPNEIGLINKH